MRSASAAAAAEQLLGAVYHATDAAAFLLRLLLAGTLALIFLRPTAASALTGLDGGLPAATAAVIFTVHRTSSSLLDGPKDRRRTPLRPVRISQFQYMHFPSLRPRSPIDI